MNGLWSERAPVGGLAAEPPRGAWTRSAPPCCCPDRRCQARFLHLRTLTAGTRQHRELRNRLVEEHLALVHEVTRRFDRSGLPMDDIRQAAALALVQAVDRFQPGRGTPFHAFAFPTVGGAVKRHFRDERWMLRTPRRIKDLRLEIGQVTDSLTQRLGHAPTTAEMAAELHRPEEDVIDGLDAETGYRPLSLDAPASPAGADSRSLAAALGHLDESLRAVEDRETVYALLARLPSREREILLLRFFGNMSQTEIAARVGLSQMHVSRLLRKALDGLRQQLAPGTPSPGPEPAGQPAPHQDTGRNTTVPRADSGARSERRRPTIAPPGRLVHRPHRGSLARVARLTAHGLRGERQRLAHVRPRAGARRPDLARVSVARSRRSTGRSPIPRRSRFSPEPVSGHGGPAPGRERSGRSPPDDTVATALAYGESRTHVSAGRPRPWRGRRVSPRRVAYVPS